MTPVSVGDVNCHEGIICHLCEMGVKMHVHVVTMPTFNLNTTCMLCKCNVHSSCADKEALPQVAPLFSPSPWLLSTVNYVLQNYTFTLKF